MGAININRVSDPSGYAPVALARLESRLKLLGLFDAGDNPAPAQMRSAVAAYLGTVLQDEIINDPKGLYGGAASDAEFANIMSTRTVDVKFVPQTPLLKRTAVNGNILTCVAENGRPLTLSRFLGAQGLGIRFYELTPTVALRNGRIPQSGFLSDVQIQLNSIPAQMTDADLFRVEVRVGKVLFERLRELYRGVPLAPNNVTATDISEARA